MGAAGSVQSVYLDASNWFQTYFDSEIYISDFQAMDRNHDGGVTFAELNKWVSSKADSEGGPWKVFISNPAVLKYAHQMAAKRFGDHFANSKKTMFTISDFRTFLVQYFAISILWVHFNNAEEHSGKLESNADKLQMTFEEFKLAVATITETHLHESVNETQLRADFAAMDTNQSNSLSFLEVCTYCCRFMDPNHAAENAAVVVGDADAVTAATTAADEECISPATKKLKEQREAMEITDEMNNLADPTIADNDIALPPELRQQLDSNPHRTLSTADVNATIITAAATTTSGAVQGFEAVNERSAAYAPARRNTSVQSEKLKNLMAVDDLQQALDREKSTAKLAEFKVEADQAMAELMGGDDND